MRTLLIAALGLGLAAPLHAQAEGERFVLESVAGEALPATFEIPAGPATLMMTFHAATLTLFGDGRATLDAVLSQVGTLPDGTSETLMEQERIPQSGRYAVRSGRLVLTWIDEAGESRPDVVEAEYDGETIRVPIDTYPGEHMVYRKVQR